MMHATTATEIEIDTTDHVIDSALITDSKDEVAVWGYLMTQYNLLSSKMAAKMASIVEGRQP